MCWYNRTVGTWLGMQAGASAYLGTWAAGNSYRLARAGRCLAVMGPSGAGKSLLLHSGLAELTGHA